MNDKPKPYFTLVKSDHPNARFGEVELHLTHPTFADTERELKQDFNDFKADGYAIVTSTGYLLFERVSADTYRFIGFTTVTPKKTDKKYAIFDQEGFYGAFLR